MTPAERAGADPEFAAAVRSAYSGALDVGDALVWLESPLRPGPTGAPSPAVRVAALRAAVYAQDAASDAVQRYEAASAGWDAELRAIRSAVDAQPAEPATESPGPADDSPREAPAVGSPIVAESGTARFEAAAVAVDVEPRRSTLRRFWPGFVAAATAVLVVFGAGMWIGASAGGSAGAHASPKPSATSEGEAAGNSILLTDGPLSMFVRGQTAADRPTTPVGNQLVLSSFRLVETLSDLGARAYAATNRDGNVCLVVITAETRVSASCTTVFAFSKSGITLDMTISRDPTDDSGKNTEVETLFTWKPAGTSVGSFGVSFPQSN
jgi:hypothetical protein